jgi:hypothetical protein
LRVQASSEMRLWRLGTSRVKGIWRLYVDAAPALEAGGERRNAYKPSGRVRKLSADRKDAPSRLGEGFCWKR